MTGLSFFKADVAEKALEKFANPSTESLEPQDPLPIILLKTRLKPDRSPKVFTSLMAEFSI